MVIDSECEVGLRVSGPIALNYKSVRVEFFGRNGSILCITIRDVWNLNEFSLISISPSPVLET